MISVLFFPFLACIILVFMHVYFGTLVLRRGVIFIDLALAQWAALGYLVGVYMDIHSHLVLFLMGVGFTVIASLILTILKPLYRTINLQEAIIGAVYIVATTIAVALISSTGMEGHHLKDMLSGHLLFIQKTELILAYMLYAVIIVLLLCFHKHILNKRSIKWDFIFYILFGVVVTSSVKMVGILLVFSYLVLPVLSTILFTKKLKNQIKWGWVIGLLASILGLLLSIKLDIPPTYCIILGLSGIWCISTVCKFVINFRGRLK